jgi:RHS repeat-associated protein
LSASCTLTPFPGRLKQTTDPSGIVTSFLYDAAGNRKFLTDGMGRTTSFLYDSLNRLTHQTHPNGDTVVHSWQLDRKVSETDPAGRVTSFDYDVRGRLTLQKAATSGLGTGAMESRRIYDAAGRLAKAVDLTQAHRLSTPGVAGRYLYDKLGRLITEVGYASNSDSTGLTHFHYYDRAGNRVRSELACGMGVAKRLLTTTLDMHHRPVILHDDNQTPGVTTDDRLTRWNYDTAGRLVRSTLANGQIQVNHYDAAGRLVLRALHRQPAAGQTISNATLLASFTWNHDAAGNVKSQTENWYASGSQPARSRATAMVYDASNRLVEERIHDSGGTDPVVTTYSYDAANNRTSKTVVIEGWTVLPGQESGHWSYTYNTANQLTRWEKYTAPGTPGILEAAGYTYDANGNRTSKVVDGTTSLALRTTTYIWDSWNRLAEVLVPVTATSKKSYEYTYDYRMRRKSIRQSGGGLKTHHTAVVFNGGLSVAEFRRSSNAALSPTTLPWARYLRGPDMGGGVDGLLGTLRHPVNSYERPVSPTASNPVTERVNLSNGRGDIVAQSDVAGTLTWTASYEAYGKRTLELGSNEDRQRANTKEEDPTGLLNEGYRYRDIETGVWLSRDPAGFVDGPNLYAYVKQNPWTAFDPDGLAEVKGYYPNKERNGVTRLEADNNGAPLTRTGENGKTEVLANHYTDWGDRNFSWFNGPQGEPNSSGWESAEKYGVKSPTSSAKRNFETDNDPQANLRAIGDAANKPLVRGLNTAIQTAYAEGTNTLAGAFVGGLLKGVQGVVKGLIPAANKGLGGNPFKNKTAAEIDEMFTKKGFTKSGPDPAGGTGGYVNPKTGRSFHIDPKDWGKYREPNHVDVNRPRDYKGPLDKKKLPYKEDK